MTRLAASISDAWSAICDAVRPEPDTTEGAVSLGLLLVAGGLLVAGLPALALIVPGALLIIIGVLPALTRRR